MPDADIKNGEYLLVRRASDGDRDAQKAIYGHHIRYLTAVCARYVVNQEDIKDVLQESFIRIFSSLKSFDYRGEGSLRAWLGRIVVNRAMDHLKQSGRIVFMPLTDECADIGDCEPETAGVPSEVLFRLIRELPDGYRTIFNLYVIEGKSHREIAAMLNIKESTSASQLHRAKAMLASKIRQYQSEPETIETI